MPVSQKTVPVDDSAPTALFNAAHNRRRFVIHNDSGQAIYVGGPTVTTTDGHVIADGGTFEVVQQFSTDASAKYQWYAICSAAPANIRVVEVTG